MYTGVCRHVNSEAYSITMATRSMLLFQPFLPNSSPHQNHPRELNILEEHITSLQDFGGIVQKLSLSSCPQKKHSLDTPRFKVVEIEYSMKGSFMRVRVGC